MAKFVAFAILTFFVCFAATRTVLHPETSFVCPLDDGFFADNYDECKQNFWICIESIPYPETCPDSSLFDPWLERCSSSCKAFKCPPQDGLYAQPGECSNLFWLCVGGSSSPQHCRNENTVFDEDRGICLPPEEASCSKPF